LKLEELQRFADHRLLIIQGKLQRIRERNWFSRENPLASQQRLHCQSRKLRLNEHFLRENNGIVGDVNAHHFKLSHSGPNRLSYNRFVDGSDREIHLTRLSEWFSLIAVQAGQAVLISSSPDWLLFEFGVHCITLFLPWGQSALAPNCPYLSLSWIVGVHQFTSFLYF
jgi:hypothetical protein